MGDHEQAWTDVCGAVIISDGRVLLAQRPTGSHLAGTWEFPGGKRHPGETDADCLRRELDEELGIRILVFDLLMKVCHRYPEKAVRLSFYRCLLAPKSPPPKSLENQKFELVPLAEISRYELPPADAPLGTWLNRVAMYREHNPAIDRRKPVLYP